MEVGQLQAPCHVHQDLLEVHLVQAPLHPHSELVVVPWKGSPSLLEGAHHLQAQRQHAHLSSWMVVGLQPLPQQPSQVGLGSSPDLPAELKRVMLEEISHVPLVNSQPVQRPREGGAGDIYCAGKCLAV